MAPQTIEGLKRYLGSGLIKGIGPEFASRIVATFGASTLDVLDAAPYRIAEVPGIGRARALAVQEAWSRQREIRRVMVFLQGYGLSPSLAARIYKRYERKARRRRSRRCARTPTSWPTSLGHRVSFRRPTGQRPGRRQGRRRAGGCRGPARSA